MARVGQDHQPGVAVEVDEPGATTCRSRASITRSARPTASSIASAIAEDREPGAAAGLVPRVTPTAPRKPGRAGPVDDRAVDDQELVAARLPVRHRAAHLGRPRGSPAARMLGSPADAPPRSAAVRAARRVLTPLAAGGTPITRDGVVAVGWRPGASPGSASARIGRPMPRRRADADRPPAARAPARAWSTCTPTCRSSRTPASAPGSTC